MFTLRIVRNLFTAFAFLLISALMLFGCSEGKAEKKDTSKSSKSASQAKKEPEVKKEEPKKPDPAKLGIAYEDSIVPMLDEFGPLLKRFYSVATKLENGSIGLKSATAGMGAQQKEMQSLQKKAAAFKTTDPYLQKNHQKLVSALQLYTDALVSLQAMTSSTSQAQVDANESKGLALLDKAGNAFQAWGTGLEKDPSERIYPRISNKLEEIGSYTE